MRSLWCRPETCLAQHLAHRRRRHRDAETLELADDPFVSPVWVLPSETKDQHAQRALERRPPGPSVRVAPAAGDQLPVPAKQRLRLEREGRPGNPGQRAAQHRQQRAIRSGRPRPWGLWAEDRQLVAEDENLQLLRATWPPQQPHQREQVPDNEIHKRPQQAALTSTTARAPDLPSRTLQRAADEFANPMGWLALSHCRRRSLRSGNLAEVFHLRDCAQLPQAAFL